MNWLGSISISCIEGVHCERRPKHRKGLPVPAQEPVLSGRRKGLLPTAVALDQGDHIPRHCASYVHLHQFRGNSAKHHESHNFLPAAKLFKVWGLTCHAVGGVGEICQLAVGAILQLSCASSARRKTSFLPQRMRVGTCTCGSANFGAYQKNARYQLTIAVMAPQMRPCFGVTREIFGCERARTAAEDERALRVRDQTPSDQRWTGSSKSPSRCRRGPAGY